MDAVNNDRYQQWKKIYLRLTASDPTDVQMIEKLHRLVHEVQFSGNASNFIQGDTLRLLSTISRETSAFLLGIRYQQQAV